MLQVFTKIWSENKQERKNLIFEFIHGLSTQNCEFCRNFTLYSNSQCTTVNGVIGTRADVRSFRESYGMLYFATGALVDISLRVWQLHSCSLGDVEE